MVGVHAQIFGPTDHGPWWWTSPDFPYHLVQIDESPSRIRINGVIYPYTMALGEPPASAPANQTMNTIRSTSGWSWMIDWYEFYADVILTHGTESTGAELISPGFGKTHFPRAIIIQHTSCVAINKNFSLRIRKIDPTFRIPLSGEYIRVFWDRVYTAEVRWRYTETVQGEFSVSGGVAAGAQSDVGVAIGVVGSVTPRELVKVAMPIGIVQYNSQGITLGEVINPGMGPGN